VVGEAGVLRMLYILTREYMLKEGLYESR